MDATGIRATSLTSQSFTGPSPPAGVSGRRAGTRQDRSEPRGTEREGPPLVDDRGQEGMVDVAPSVFLSKIP